MNTSENVLIKVIKFEELEIKMLNEKLQKLKFYNFIKKKKILLEIEIRKGIISQILSFSLARNVREFFILHFGN